MQHDLARLVLFLAACVGFARALPRDTPPHLGEVAYLLCADCDLDAQFAFGLDLVLTGLRARQRKR